MNVTLNGFAEELGASILAKPHPTAGSHCRVMFGWNQMMADRPPRTFFLCSMNLHRREFGCFNISTRRSMPE